MTQDTQEVLDFQAVEAVALVTAYIENHHVPYGDLSILAEHARRAIKVIYGEPETPRPDPAVPIDESVTDEYIICLEDGKKLKMLKRYLRTHYDMTPEEYRERWGLPADYPMISPEYSGRRSQFAKNIGLGKR